MPGSFFDTNVLLYLMSGDTAKADRAERVVEAGGTISVRVLNEITSAVQRRMPMSWTETHAFLFAMRSLLTVLPITVETHEARITLAERYGLSIYDAMIAASALHADCGTRWSEDMQDGMMIENRLRITNPFRDMS